MELRQGLRVKVRCPVLYSGSQVAGEGTVVDLGTGGWQVVAGGSVPRGTPLALRVSLPDGKDPMQVELGTVRWSSGQSFGIKNMILGEEEWKRLRQFLTDNARRSAPPLTVWGKG